MPALEDAGARTDDGGRTLDTLPTDAARMDAAGLPPMPPPIDAAIERDVRFPDPPPMPIYFDTEVEPDADLVAPMPRPTQARP